MAETGRTSPHVEPIDLPPASSGPGIPLDYEHRESGADYDPGANWIVRVLGVLIMLAGLVTWFTAYIGVDDRWQVTIGIIITGFGVTWWILGAILRVLEERER